MNRTISFIACFETTLVLTAFDNFFSSFKVIIDMPNLLELILMIRASDNQVGGTTAFVPKDVGSNPSRAPMDNGIKELL